MRSLRNGGRYIKSSYDTHKSCSNVRLKAYETKNYCIFDEFCDCANNHAFFTLIFTCRVKIECLCRSVFLP